MTVAELQSDPDFLALSPAAQERVLSRAIPMGAAQYKGEPDEPLVSHSMSDKAAGNLVRYGGPIAGAALGPGGFLAGLGAAGAVGAGSSAAADALEGKGFDAGRTALGGATNMLAAGASRPLGALAGVAGAKMGLKPPPSGSLDLSALQGMARNAGNVKGLLGGRAAGAAETIDDVLSASGGSVPINAPSLKPSAELIRKGIPYKQPGGKEMYGALRGAVKDQSPAYDKLLQQYRSSHALTDIPSMKELVAALSMGGAGFHQGGLPGILAVLIPRLLKSASYAPAAPGIQSGLSSGLTGFADLAE